MSSDRLYGVLFLCTHNAGRSQMAAGFMRTLGAGKVRVFSGGSEPASQLNPAAIEVMNEVSIDIANYVPQKWSMEMLHEVDVVVTMGCGDSCPYIPGKRYVDWPLEDPAGRGADAVRPIRDEIKSLVEQLLADLTNG